MVSIGVKLTLPDDLALEAGASGLLEPAALEGTLREELRRRRVEAIFSAADRRAGLSGAMTEAEVEAEVADARRLDGRGRPKRLC